MISFFRSRADVARFVPAKEETAGAATTGALKTAAHLAARAASDEPPSMGARQCVTTLAELGAFEAMDWASMLGVAARAFDADLFAVIRLPHQEQQRYVVLVSTQAGTAALRSFVALLKEVVGDVGRFAATDEVVRTVNARVRREQALHMSDPSALETLAATLFERALDMGGSDLHIEVRDSAEVFVRIYGERAHVQTLSRETGQGLASLLFESMADHSAKREVKWSPDIPIDAVIMHRRKNGSQVQVRFASAPIYPSGSFQIVCRLLPMDPQRAPALESIGYSAAQIEAIESMLMGSQGLVLLVGPTNSGKSTSMQALVRKTREIRGHGIKIESIEDPVEYLIDGACQMPVSSRAEFYDLLKSSLRHDPDVLMVGEIRDRESADAIKNMVLAGRKIFATLHAYEAMAAHQRLLCIGVPPDVLYMRGFISGVIYQRLLARLCPHCAMDMASAREMGLLDDGILRRLDRSVLVSQSNIRVRNPKGCAHCADKIPGLNGREVVAEILPDDDEIRTLLAQGQQAAAARRWMECGVQTTFGVTALAHAMEKMVQGLVDPRDVESQVGLIRRQDSAATASTVVSAGGAAVHALSALGTASVAGVPDDGLFLSSLYERRG